MNSTTTPQSTREWTPSKSMSRRTAVALLFAVATFMPGAVHGNMMAIPLLQYTLTMDACQTMNNDYSQHKNVINTDTTHQYAFANYGALQPGMSLKRNVTASSCALGMGIEAKQGETAESLLSGSHSIGTLLQELSNPTLPFISEDGGLTMAVWIQHGTNEEDRQLSDAPKPLLTIGNANKDTPSTASTPCDNINLQLSLIEDQQLEWVYRTSDPFFSPCQRMVVDLPDSHNTTLAHIAISLADREQQIFYNGELIAQQREIFDHKLQHWDHSSELQLFSFPDDASDASNITTQAWSGQLFEFSVYSGAMKQQGIEGLLSEGLPPTQPYALPMTTHILEDAQDENGKLQSIQLPIVYLDQKVEQLLTDLGIAHQPAAKARLYVIGFPSRGTLISPEGHRTIESAEGMPTFVNQETQGLIFLPPTNEHSDFPGSPYASFEYCWTSNMIVSSSQCTSATVYVVVDSVNDPPMAIAPPTYIVYEGINEEMKALHLTGFDVDNDDSITAIKITTPPSLGYLYISVGSFREQDNLLHGTLLSDIDNSVSGKEAWLEYSFSAYDQVVVQGNTVTDYFHFRVQDSRGAWSEEAIAQIQIHPNVFPKTDGENVTRLVLSNNSGAELLLSWDDHSGLDRLSGVFIESLPKQGVLLDNSKNVIQDQSLIPSTSNNLALEYQPSPQSCNQENAAYLQDSLSYKVVSLGHTGQISSASNLTTTLLSVQCPVKPVLLDTDHNVMNVTVFSPGVDDACNGYRFNFSDQPNQCNGKIALLEIQIQNHHLQPQPVLVSITSLNGFVTLNTQATEAANLIGNHEVVRSAIRLLSPPEKLQEILSNIHFQSEVVGLDEIQIVVEYGPQCNHSIADSLEKNSSTVGVDCYQQEIVIPIQVHPKQESSKQYFYRDFPWIPMPFSLFMLLFIKLRGKSREIMARNEDLKWQGHYDPESDSYYYEHQVTGEVTWKSPPNPENVLLHPDEQHQEIMMGEPTAAPTSCGTFDETDQF